MDRRVNMDRFQEPNPDPEQVECEICADDIYEHDIIVCEQCGRKTCEDCSIECAGCGRSGCMNCTEKDLDDFYCTDDCKPEPQDLERGVK